MLKIFKDAFGFTLRSNNLLRTVFVHGLLLTFSVSVLPLILVFGYQYDVFIAAFEGRKKLPRLRLSRQKAVQGGKILLITIAYGFVPTLIILYIISRTFKPGRGLLPVVTGDILLLIIGCLAVFIPMLLLPHAFSSYATKGRLTAAFRLSDIGVPLHDSSYWKSVILVELAIILGCLFIILCILLTFGSFLLVSPFAISYIWILNSYVLGTAYGEAIGKLDPEDRNIVEFSAEEF